jgi:tRNA-specific 2-thiouridylase
MRVVVAMSGGVDSSVAAMIARDAGHDVVGISLQLWDHSGIDENRFGTCCSPDDLYDARRVAEQIGIPFYVVNAQADFRRHVVDAFTASYLRAETPNPCVHCNNHVKFDRLLELARGLGADLLATGHYARKTILPDGRYALRRAVDPAKDQTYFLFHLDQERLERIWFPLGEMTKQEVREYAMARGLPTASKHDSQELCFVPDNDYAGFIEAQGVKADPGEIIDLEGRVRGRHRGLFHYTVGQRKGLGISSSDPLYVVALDHGANRVIVGPDRALFQQGLEARGVNWISGQPAPDEEVSARIRYRARDAAVRWRLLEAGRYEIRFAEPQRALTPGQAIVFYKDDRVLGGGWIHRNLQPGFVSDVPSLVV